MDLYNLTNCSGYAEKLWDYTMGFGDERYMGKYGELMCPTINIIGRAALMTMKKELKRTKQNAN